MIDNVRGYRTNIQSEKKSFVHPNSNQVNFTAKHDIMTYVKEQATKELLSLPSDQVLDLLKGLEWTKPKLTNFLSGKEITIMDSHHPKYGDVRIVLREPEAKDYPEDTEVLLSIAGDRLYSSGYQLDERDKLYKFAKSAIGKGKT